MGNAGDANGFFADGASVSGGGPAASGRQRLSVPDLFLPAVALFRMALVQGAREDLVVERLVYPLAQRVVFSELLANVARVGPGGPLGVVVFSCREARVVGGVTVAVAVRCEQPGRVLPVVPRVAFLVGREGPEGDVGGKTGRIRGGNLVEKGAVWQQPSSAAGAGARWWLASGRWSCRWCTLWSWG